MVYAELSIFLGQIAHLPLKKAFNGLEARCCSTVYQMSETPSN
jgi:hypothetical protein